MLGGVPVSSISNPALRAQAEAGIKSTRIIAAFSRRSEPRNAAGDPCATIYGTERVTQMGVTVADYYQNTYFCWNGTQYGPWSSADLVTSHSTTWSVGITTAGSVASWKYGQNITGMEFHCFTSGYGFSGGINKCSGNYEYQEVQFEWCPIRIGCVGSADAWIEQAEYLNGDYYQTGGVS